MHAKKRKSMFEYVQLKALAGYLEPGFIGLFFSLFVDVRFGVSFLVCLLILPVVSIFLAYWTARRIEVVTELSSSVLSKGDTVMLNVEIASSGFWSLCRINAELEESVRFSSGESAEISFYPGIQHSRRFERTYKGQFWGSSGLGMRKVEVNDFLGLCRFPVPLNEAETIKSIVLLPDRPQLTENELLRASVEASSIEEDEDAQNLTLASGGVPGYEHRAYVPGDSFRRINWKLSAKRDIYMVRLPEPISKSTQTLVLDPYIKALPADPKRQVKNEELIVETLLGVCGLLVRQAMECSVYYHMENVWHCDVICNDQDISKLQYTLARFTFSQDINWGTRLPDVSGNRGGSLLLFTGAPDSLLLEGISNLENVGFASQTIVPKDLAITGSWAVDDDFTIGRKDF